MDTNKKFLDPEQVLFKTGLDRSAVVVDLGAGSGFFATAAGKIVGDDGRVFVVDILESALAHVSSEARIRRLRNIQTIRHDLEKGEVPQIAAGSADLIVAANLLHQLADSDNLMKEVYRLLKTGGKLLVIDWNQNMAVIGPKPEHRVTETDIKTLAQKVHLKFKNAIETDHLHFGLLFVK